MTRTRHQLLAAIAGIACLAFGATAGAGVASATELKGAGSSLIKPLMAYWAQDFGAKTGNTITYASVGSGQGISQISAAAVDFGASDAPLTPAQFAGCANCVQIPWALTATGIGYNIPGVTKLNLSGDVLAKIYLGSITNWNDPQIQKINKTVTMPNLKITPVFRQDPSGDTYAFTDFLSSVSPQWKSQVGRSTQVNFPAGVGAAKNDGVTAVVGSTAGALDYASAAYLISNHQNAAGLQNRAGKYVFPNLKNISAAAKSVKKVPANNEVHIVDPSKKFKEAYPLSTFTNVIFPTTAPQKALLVSFVKYVLTTGQQFGAALDFAPIPKVVLKASNKTLKAMGG